MKRIVSPPIEKLSDLLIMVALMEMEEESRKEGIKKFTTNELSEHLHMSLNSPKSKVSISEHLRRLENTGHIFIERGKFLDERKILIGLTSVGRLQAQLGKISLHGIEGRDDLAGAVERFYNEAKLKFGKYFKRGESG